MKKIIALITIVLSSHFTLAASMPANYSLSCWDGSFAYNRFDIRQQGPSSIITVSGMALGRNQSIFGAGIRQLDIIVPRSSCRITDRDPKLFTCKPEQMVVRASIAGKTQVRTQRGMELQTRMVVAPGNGWQNSSQLGLNVSYEFAIREGVVSTPLTVFLGSGAAADNKHRCVLTANN